MVLTNDRYKIDIQIDSNFRYNSSDNSCYDFVYDPQNMLLSDFYRAFSITVERENKNLKIALVGDYYICDDNCAVLDGTVLTVLLNDFVCKIDLEAACIIDVVIIDDFGCNIGLYMVHSGFIIHGEIVVRMLDFDLKQLWEFCGKDIFVSVTDKKPFELSDDRIKLYDFEDNYYELDYNGHLLITTWGICMKIGIFTDSNYSSAEFTCRKMNLLILS